MLKEINAALPRGSSEWTVGGKKNDLITRIVQAESGKAPPMRRRAKRARAMPGSGPGGGGSGVSFPELSEVDILSSTDTNLVTRAQYAVEFDRDERARKSTAELFKTVDGLAAQSPGANVAAVVFEMVTAPFMAHVLVNVNHGKLPSNHVTSQQVLSDMGVVLALCRFNGSMQLRMAHLKSVYGIDLAWSELKARIERWTAFERTGHSSETMGSPSWVHSRHDPKRCATAFDALTAALAAMFGTRHGFYVVDDDTLVTDSGSALGAVVVSDRKVGDGVQSHIVANALHSLAVGVFWRTPASAENGTNAEQFQRVVQSVIERVPGKLVGNGSFVMDSGYTDASMAPKMASSRVRFVGPFNQRHSRETILLPEPFADHEAAAAAASAIVAPPPITTTTTTTSSATTPTPPTPTPTLPPGEHYLRWDGKQFMVPTHNAAGDRSVFILDRRGTVAGSFLSGMAAAVNHNTRHSKTEFAQRFGIAGPRNELARLQRTFVATQLAGLDRRSALFVALGLERKQSVETKALAAAFSAHPFVPLTESALSVDWFDSRTFQFTATTTAHVFHSLWTSARHLFSPAVCSVFDVVGEDSTLEALAEAEEANLHETASTNPALAGEDGDDAEDEEDAQRAPRGRTGTTTTTTSTSTAEQAVPLGPVTTPTPTTANVNGEGGPSLPDLEPAAKHQYQAFVSLYRLQSAQAVPNFAMKVGSQNEESIRAALSVCPAVQAMGTVGLLASTRVPGMVASPDGVCRVCVRLGNDTVSVLAANEYKTRVSEGELAKARAVGDLFPFDPDTNAFDVIEWGSADFHKVMYDHQHLVQVVSQQVVMGVEYGLYAVASDSEMLFCVVLHASANLLEQVTLFFEEHFSPVLAPFEPLRRPELLRRPDVHALVMKRFDQMYGNVTPMIRFFVSTRLVRKIAVCRAGLVVAPMPLRALRSIVCAVNHEYSINHSGVDNISERLAHLERLQDLKAVLPFEANQVMRMLTLVASSSVQAVRLCRAFKHRTMKDARLKRLYNHELMRRAARTRGGNFTDHIVELGVALFRRSAPSVLGSPPATDMSGQIIAVGSSGGVLAGHAAQAPTPVRRLVQALNRGVLHGGVLASPAVLQHHHQEWHRTFQVAMDKAKEREGKGARCSRDFVSSQFGTLLRTHAVWPHERERMGRRTWCVGCNNGRDRKVGSLTSWMCSLCRVAVCDGCWGGFHSRVDFFSSLDAEVTQGAGGGGAGAAQPEAIAAQPGAGAATSGSVPLRWDDDDDEEE